MHPVAHPTVQFPPVAGPAKGSQTGDVVSARFRREYSTWQRGLEKTRPLRENRRLPKVLDEMPKAWLMRSSAGDDDAPGQTVDAEQLHATPRLDEASESGRHEVARLQELVNDARNASDMDREKLRHTLGARQAARERTRARISTELDEAQRRYEEASMAEDEARSERADQARQTSIISEPLVRQTERSRAAASESKDEIEKLRQSMAEHEARAAEDDSELAALQERASMLQAEVDTASLKYQQANAERASRRRGLRWRSLCEALTEHAQATALKLAAEEFEEDARRYTEEAEDWKARRFVDQEAAAAHKSETAEMLKQVEQLELEAQHALTSYLSNSLGLRSRTSTPMRSATPMR